MNVHVSICIVHSNENQNEKKNKFNIDEQACFVRKKLNHKKYIDMSNRFKVQYFLSIFIHIL